MNQQNETNIDSINEMIQVARNFLNLESRGFKESYRSAKPGKLIYNSEWCRISLIWGGWDYETGNTIHIRYGRLHALNERLTMIWNGEECRCWHRVEHALHFLDGRSPEDTAKLNYSHPVIKPFYEEEMRKLFDLRQPEWLAQIHVTVWEYYGKHLFELFDLRKPELWNEYSQFLKRVYDIEGRDSDIEPSLDKVC